MIYASTRRAYWNATYTALKFLLTCLVLGIPVALLMRLGAAVWSASGGFPFRLPENVREFCQCLLTAAAAKLGLEAAIFSWLRAKTFTPLRRTAVLLTGDLARATSIRFVCGVIGGLMLPGLLLVWSSQAGETASFGLVAVVV